MTDKSLYDMNVHPNMTNSEILKMVFASFSNGIRSAKATTPREYLEGLKLDFETVHCGFNSGQVHHRRDAVYLEQLMKVGLITQSTVNNRPGLLSYTLFGKFGIVFPLKDEHGNIVNLYADRFETKDKTKEFLNDQGLYPGFPSNISKKVVITHSLYDSATLIQSGMLDNREAVMALLDGELLEQHTRALASCQYLEEVILVSCSEEVVKFIVQKFPHVIVSELVVPDGKTLNEVWKESDQETLLRLMQQRIYHANAPHDVHDTLPIHEPGGLIHIHEQKMLWKGEIGNWYIQGGISSDFSRLQVTLTVHLPSGQIVPCKCDLFDATSRNQLATLLHAHGVNPADCESDCMMLVLLLDQWRDMKLFPEPSTKHGRIVQDMPHQRQKEIIQFLSAQNVLSAIDAKICEAGVIGEDVTRLCVFVIASSYKQKNPMHAIIQGSSGSGKTHLISAIAGCIPPEEVLSLTRLTNSSFYYLGEDDLSGKLLVLQDLDGLSAEALYALRELQSAKMISNFRPNKDKQTGAIKTVSTEVKGSFASLMATTKGTVYFDNLSRSIMLGVDESLEQSHAIVRYQNKKRSGMIEPETEHTARAFLQDIQRMLKSYTVINPYAHSISMPVQGLLLRRLNDQFASFIEQITILHQYQRKIDEQGRLVTTREDIRLAIDLFFEPIFLKVDDLDSSLRQFFEHLKVYVKQHIPEGRFRQRDIRHGLQYSRTHVAHFFKELKEREYIRIVGGTANRGFLYEIEYWDDVAKLKATIREALLEQLEAME